MAGFSADEEAQLIEHLPVICSRLVMLQAGDMSCWEFCLRLTVRRPPLATFANIALPLPVPALPVICSRLVMLQAGDMSC